MRPSTPHYTSPADLRERLNQPRIQTGVKPFNGGAICGLMITVLLEGVVVAIWFAIRFLLRFI